MKRDILIKKHWQFIFFNLLTIFLFVIFYGHFGNIIVDSFREAYIPTQMLSGQVLYKNIFCIYPPLAYIVNSVLMFVFGQKLCVLYFIGLLLSLGILNTTFLISNKFMPKIYSLSIVLFIISVSFLSPNVFNFVLPYSYGAMYGILFALLSIYFGLTNHFKLMYFMYALAICSKYEFVFLLPILCWYSGLKEFLKNIITLIFTPILVFLPLFIMGLSFNELKEIWQVIIAMSSSKTLYWFYSVSGLTFRPELLPIYGLNFLKFFIPLVFMYYFRHWFLVILTVIYFWFAASPELFVYVYPLILIMLLFNFKEINIEKKFVIISSIAVSIKLFFALTFLSYGVYFVPFALIALFLSVPKRYKKPLMIIIFILVFIYGVKNSNTLSNKNIKIKTDNGIVYVNDFYGISIDRLVDYINMKTNKDDKLLVLPECTAINFLTGRNTDNKFYSLIPLYIETFGEENIIARLSKFKPDYIIISNYDTSNYYYSYFGQDYAKKVYDYINDNYQLITNIGKGFIFSIYKLKQ